MDYKIKFQLNIKDENIDKASAETLLTFITDSVECKITDVEVEEE